MALARATAVRLSVRQYSSGAITSNTQDQAPGTDSAQILRRTTFDLALTKDTYQSAENRSDRQVVDFRHGARSVTGTINGEFSPLTYFNLLVAAHEDTAGATISKTQSDYTSVVSSSTGTFTFAGGNPVTDGFRVGDIIRFTGLAATANNSKNFLITGFSGTQNRVLSVYPAPTTDAVADTTFGVSRPGKSTYVPSSGFVTPKYAIERYYTDLDFAELFTECRVGGYTIDLPATGISTIAIPIMGRDMTTFSSSNAPYFVSPSAETTTGVLAAVNGVLRVGGSAVGVVTGLNIQLQRSPSTRQVVGQNFSPEVFLGRAVVSGTINAMLESATFIDYFRNETEVEVLAYLAASTADAADAVSIYLPRIKVGGASATVSGESEIGISMPFTALKYNGSTAGVETTTIRVCDTAS